MNNWLRTSTYFRHIMAAALLQMLAPAQASTPDVRAENAVTASMHSHSKGASLATPGLMLAKEAAPKKGVRQRNISGQAKERRSGDKTTIDFDAADIAGSRKTPLGSMINQNRADKEYDFVKIRLSWHPEMINSAASLDTKND